MTTQFPQHGLKQLLGEAQSVVTAQDEENFTKNIFRGAGVIRVTVSENIGKALDLPQDYVQSNSKKSYVIGTISTNGSLDYAEELVRDIIKDKGVEAYAHTYLT